MSDFADANEKDQINPILKHEKSSFFTENNQKDVKSWDQDIELKSIVVLNSNDLDLLGKKLGIQAPPIKKKSKKSGLIKDKGSIPMTYSKPKDLKPQVNKIPKSQKVVKKSSSPQSRNAGLSPHEHNFTGKRVKKTRNQSWNMTINTKVKNNTKTIGQMMKLSHKDQTPLIKNDKSKNAEIKNAMHKIRKLETINDYDMSQFESKETKQNVLRNDIIQERMDLNDQLVDEIEEKLKLFDVISYSKK